MKISDGKRSGLEALSDSRGVIAALAIDQRSALRKLFAKALGCLAAEVPERLLVEFKTHVSQILTPLASAILLDPEYGLPAVAQRHAGTGLLLAYEQTGYDARVPGRLPGLLDGFSVKRLKQAGADAVKVLLYYSPESARSINLQKQELVERVGGECQDADIPFFLELVSYHDDLSAKERDFARIKPAMVTRSTEEFCNPRYAVDVLKVGVPVNMHFVESPTVPRDEALYSHAEVEKYFRQASDATSLPFIYLSEGVSNELFCDALRIAEEAGSAFSGVLCGRATWQDGVPVFVQKGAAALEEWLRGPGTRNIERVNVGLRAACPWQERVAAASSGKG